MMQPIAAAVEPIAPQEEVTEILNSGRLIDLPVVSFDGVLLGVVTQQARAGHPGGRDQ